MALTLIEQARLYIYDIPANEMFYPLFDDEEWEYFLSQKNDDPLQAARLAAGAAYFKFATYSTKEKTGDIEVWNNAFQGYKDAINSFFKDQTLFPLMPNGAVPYAAGISASDLNDDINNTDKVKTPFDDIFIENRLNVCRQYFSVNPYVCDES